MRLLTYCKYTEISGQAPFFLPPALQRTSRRSLQARLFLGVGSADKKRSQVRFEPDQLRYALRTDAVFAADLPEQYARVGAHFLGHVRAVALEKVREGVDGAARGCHGRADVALNRGARGGGGTTLNL